MPRSKTARAWRAIARELDITWRFPAVILGGAAVVGGLLLWKCHADRTYAESGPGELRGAHLVELDDRHAAIVIGEVVTTHHGNHGSSTDGRLDAIDASDGHRLARVLTSDHFECVAAAPGLAWCNTNHGTSSDLELRDAATLAVRVPHATVVAAAPALAQQHRPSIDARTGEAWMMTADGRFWHVDPRTLRSGIEDHDVDRADAIDLGPNSSPLMGSLVTPPTSLQFDGTPRARLQSSDGVGGSRQIGAEAFIAPQFIVETGGARRASPPPLALDGGKVVLIAHRATVDAGAALLVTAIGLDGKRRWTTTLAHGEIRAAWLVDHHVVLAIAAEPQGSVTALDEGDGHVAWRVGT